MMSYKKCLARGERDRQTERKRERQTDGQTERERESMDTAVLNAHRYYYLSFRIRLAAVCGEPIRAGNLTDFS